jgi:hypothetical protein
MTKTRKSRFAGAVSVSIFALSIVASSPVLAGPGKIQMMKSAEKLSFVSARRQRDDVRSERRDARRLERRRDREEREREREIRRHARDDDDEHHPKSP